MATPEWKWLLQQMDDRDLIRVAKTLRLRLIGFRGSRWERHWSAVRPRVLQILLQSKTLPRVQLALNAFVKRDNGLLQMRQLSGDELKDRLSSGIKPERVLLALLSSPDQRLVQRAQQLFDHLRTTGALEGWLAAEQQPTGEQEHERIEQELHSLRQQQTTYEEQRQLLCRQIADLEAEIADLRASSSRSQRLWELERQSLLSRMADRDTRLQLREQQLANLRQQQEIDREAAPLEEQQSADNDQAADGKSVLLVGSVAAEQIGIFGRYGVTQISPNDIQQELALAMINQADEIWLLTYATPLPIQRRLRRDAADRLRCFASYEELLVFAEQKEKE